RDAVPSATAATNGFAAMSKAVFIADEMLEEWRDGSLRSQAAAPRAPELRPRRELDAKHAPVPDLEMIVVRRKSRNARARDRRIAAEHIRQLVKSQRRRLEHVAADRADAAQMKTAFDIA